MNSMTMHTRLETIYRHPWPVRVWHWLTALAVSMLLLTGALIFNVHPRLYWGEDGHAGMPAIMSLSATDTQTKTPRFELQLGPMRWNVTGKMGVVDVEGSDTYVLIAALPEDFQFGATRVWHFAWAWLLVASAIVYGLYLLVGGRFTNMLLPTRYDLTLHNLGSEIWQHLRLRRVRGTAMRKYNVLQKLSYLAIVFLVIPILILSGLTMSNSVTAVFPDLFVLFGGRQSARSVHFIAASVLVLFIVIHIAQVFVGGFANLLRSMVTGRYVIEHQDKI
jgi:thiosulfate reductase cytochrome b subunit